MNGRNVYSVVRGGYPKKYIRWSGTKFPILKLPDIPHCPAQLPHNCACKYKGNMKSKRIWNMSDSNTGNE